MRLLTFNEAVSTACVLASAFLLWACGASYPAQAYDEIRDRMNQVLTFLEEEGRRLDEKILQGGGLEPGRVRRGL